jgi:hypothetical protein
MCGGNDHASLPMNLKNPKFDIKCQESFSWQNESRKTAIASRDRVCGEMTTCLFQNEHTLNLHMVYAKNIYFDD